MENFLAHSNKSDNVFLLTPEEQKGIINLYREMGTRHFYAASARLCKCMGAGVYYAAKEAEVASDNPEYLMPMFRNISQATIAKNQKGQLFRLKEG